MIDAVTLDQLRVLIAIADTGSFSAAGRKLQRVQSAISQSVQALEATLRLQLFDRSGKRPRLTDAGRTLLADARQVIGDVEMLRGRADSIAKGLEPELTVAVGQLLPQDVGMEVLRELRQRFPDLSLRLLTGGIQAPERHLRAGTVELAIFALEVANARDLEAEFLMEVPMVPVVAAGHPLAALPGPLTRDDLGPHVQLALTDASSPDTWSRGLVSHIVWRFADMQTRLAFLLNGFGWGNMPLHMVAPHIAAGRLKRLTMKEQSGYTIALHAVHQRSKPPGRAGRWLIDRLRERLATTEAADAALEASAPGP